jgi:hypothetical protein
MQKVLMITVLLAGSSFIFQTDSAGAQQIGSNFNKARIIDDSLFYNGNEMTVQQIQQFLNARIPVCDTNGTKMHRTGQTRAQYGASVGNPAPYICLKDYVAPSTPAKSDSGLCGALPAYSNRSAAQIIDDVARACNISQKVLLVTLQKEQSLITDDWPWPVQYEKAMGYYCPDDPNRPGWCAPEYAGFFNQVYNAARQLQRYRQSPSSFNHAVNRTSYVAYQANSPSCGGTTINMQTEATAALYNYTPYQPNVAALNNLYGTGDSCSAYGNRNFWRMYRDWFGSTSANVEAFNDLFNLRTFPSTTDSTVIRTVPRNEIVTASCFQTGNPYVIDGVSGNIWLLVTNPSPGWIATDQTLLNTMINSKGVKICPVRSKPLYRAYNPVRQRHFWTGYIQERDFVLNSLGFNEGAPSFFVIDEKKTQGKPVYRLYNSSRETHFWTTDLNERNIVRDRLGFRDEGYAFSVSYGGPNTKPVWRFYDKVNERHFWTADPNERNFVTSQLGFVFEGEAFRVPM